jgi:hypothetical protein
VADPKAVLTKLHQNLNILREREARYGGNAPLELVNQIDDHEKAIALTEQAVVGELSQVERLPDAILASARRLLISSPEG